MIPYRRNYLLAGIIFGEVLENETKIVIGGFSNGGYTHDRSLQ